MVSMGRGTGGGVVCGVAQALGHSVENVFMFELIVRLEDELPCHFKNTPFVVPAFLRWGGGCCCSEWGLRLCSLLVSSNVIGMTDCQKDPPLQHGNDASRLD